MLRRLLDIYDSNPWKDPPGRAEKEEKEAKEKEKEDKKDKKDDD